MGEKTCMTCGELKPYDKFTKNRRSHDGYDYICADCLEKKRRGRPVPTYERCLYGTCPRPGEQLPQGRGFRFCDEHRKVAEKVLHHPKGVGQTLQRRATGTWACGHGQEAWNTKTYMNRGSEKNSCLSCHRGSNRYKRAPQKWGTRRAAQDHVYQELKEAHQ